MDRLEMFHLWERIVGLKLIHRLQGWVNAVFVNLLCQLKIFVNVKYTNIIIKKIIIQAYLYFYRKFQNLQSLGPT